jgi:hypothetical protein
MLTPEHRRTPTVHPAPIPFALAPAHLESTAASVPAPAPAHFPTVPSAPVTYNNQTYHHLNPSLAAQLAALPPIPTPVRGRGRGRGRGHGHVSNAVPSSSRTVIQSQVGLFITIYYIKEPFTKIDISGSCSTTDAFQSAHFCWATSEYTSWIIGNTSVPACTICCTTSNSTSFCSHFCCATSECTEQASWIIGNTPVSACTTCCTMSNATSFCSRAVYTLC